MECGAKKKKKSAHFLLPLCAAAPTISTAGLCHTVSLSATLLFCAEESAGRKHQSTLDLKALNVCAHQLGHTVEIIRALHINAYAQTAQVCNWDSSAGFVGSICSRPRLPPFVPTLCDRWRGFRLTSWGDTPKSLIRFFFLVGIIWSTHTHTSSYTHTCCEATQPWPCGARQAERHVVCLHHLLWGQTHDEGLEPTAQRWTATHTVDRCTWSPSTTETHWTKLQTHLSSAHADRSRGVWNPLFSSVLGWNNFDLLTSD